LPWSWRPRSCSWGSWWGSTFELVSVVLSVLIINIIVADGESNWLEGVQLLGAYAIIGIAFFFHP
jgi:Ca2+:H+ antiporter